MAYKGKFKPKNRDKYKGNPTNIIYRSLWERRFMVYCDSNNSVVKWSSEEIVIPYRSPFDRKIHKYYPDFWVKIKKHDGTIETSIIEVKPKSQTIPPKDTSRTRKSGRFLLEIKGTAVQITIWLAKKITKILLIFILLIFIPRIYTSLCLLTPVKT